MAPITFSYTDTCLLDLALINETAMKLHPYIDYLQGLSPQADYDNKETFINLSSDETLAQECAEMGVKFVHKDLKYIFVCGIGGSNTGAMALYQALTGAYDIAVEDGPKMIFIDTLSSFLHINVLALIDEHIEKPTDFMVNVVSKSGMTTETLANFDVLYTALQEKCGKIQKRVIVTTVKDSPLWKKSQEAGFACIDHRHVSGRYSVFSSVGQLPLRCANFDVDDMRDGAVTMKSACLTKDPHTNPALASAVCLYLHYRKGNIIHDSFHFNQELEALGKWYRQVIAESTGKEHDTQGSVVHTGITPLVTIGTTDLHSVAQLYLGGPRDKVTTFIYSPESEDLIINDESGLCSLIPGMTGKKIGTVLNVIYTSVLSSYSHHGLPYMCITFPEISENTLGQYFQMKMMEVIFLAHLLRVNAFDQPHVEEYKKMTRSELENM